ncbi:hypothetical protein PR202_gb02229 [Eleusine coracana subsp. coracana]|uniref:DUF6598 domain-containing protein n=1 Tax=Eleusine coracana subsp. coracana TaxID=191504 RepID=A0AAV5DWF9_ELECO|nr:hypothetical protein PR202_gb02229 [Eleusine coracana subsp. coracana]
MYASFAVLDSWVLDCGCKMWSGNFECAMEVESCMDGLPLPEPECVQKPKRKWGPDIELTWEQKAVRVLDICREQLARTCPEEGCNVVPTSFFDLAKEFRSSSAVPKSSGGSNKTFDSSTDDAGSRPIKVPELTDDEKILALHLVRCNEVTDYDPKFGWDTCTRFCRFNIAFFDLDEESKVGLGPPFNKLTPRDLRSLESSINVISLKIIESDLGYPINVFGTVIARDEVDYKCVYLFKRDREDSQLVNSSIRCDDGTGDRTLNKGEIEFNTARYQETTISKLFSSWYSTLELVFARVFCALEATLTVTVLKGPPDFCGTITAWTTGNKDDHIILFNNEASSTREGGCFALSRVVSVPFDEHLVLCFSVGCNQIELTLEQGQPHQSGNTD